MLSSLPLDPTALIPFCPGCLFSLKRRLFVPGVKGRRAGWAYLPGKPSGLRPAVHFAQNAEPHRQCPFHKTSRHPPATGIPSQQSHVILGYFGVATGVGT